MYIFVNVTCTVCLIFFLCSFSLVSLIEGRLIEWLFLSSKRYLLKIVYIIITQNNKKKKSKMNCSPHIAQSLVSPPAMIQVATHDKRWLLHLVLLGDDKHHANTKITKSSSRF